MGLGCCLRPTMIFLCMVGFYLLFSPIIQLLAWIPLVGWLLAWIVKIAAAITAFFCRRHNFLPHSRRCLDQVQTMCRHHSVCAGGSWYCGHLRRAYLAQERRSSCSKG